MKITSLMSKTVVTVEMDDSLAMVKEIFDNTMFHHVLVVEKNTLFGVISDRDLLKALSPDIDRASATAKDLASLNKKAHQIMSRKPITLPEHASVKDAVALFNQHTISCIPIISSNDELAGIVSWRDIMKELGARISR